MCICMRLRRWKVRAKHTGTVAAGQYSCTVMYVNVHVCTCEADGQVGGIAATASAPTLCAWAAMSRASTTLSAPTWTMTRCPYCFAAWTQAAAIALRSATVRSTLSPVLPAENTQCTPVLLR